MTNDVPARRALVLYGSETGNAQDVAEELGRLLERLRFDTAVLELNAVSLKRLLQYSVVLIAISTTGQGDLPANSQTFWKALRNARLRPGCLQTVKFASFGLGDTSYPKYNWAHRKLYNRLIQLGAQPICDRGESDEQHPEGIDGSLLPWSTTLRQRLFQVYPLPEGVGPIADDVLLEPKYLLAINEEDSLAKRRKEVPPNDSSSGPVKSLVDLPSADLLDVPQGMAASIVSNKRLTPDSHWQDVRHLILDLPGLHTYMPGDILTLYPKNFPADVNEFISIMGWTSMADLPLRMVPTQANMDETSFSHDQPALSGRPMSLRLLLTNDLDIMSIPRRSFFAHIAHFTTDEFQRTRLLEFTNPEFIDELYDYTTRPRRSILEVLQEFETVKIPWQRICSIIPAIRGRQFSIASAAKLTDAADAMTRVELLIAIVKYKTVIKRIRQGVCTRYVASLRAGQQITVTLQKGGLGVTKAETSKPIVMIGPGTGVAPMRALIQQRRAWRNEAPSENQCTAISDDVLFFGCRNADADFLFKEEWKQFKEDGVPLDVLVAFSRDQRQKVYVQDLIRQQSARVYQALAKEDGLVYICGSSGKMPQAVREALIETFQTQEEMGRGDAENYLAAMEKSGRYKQETW